MYDGDQDVDDVEQLMVCPYESSHKVTSSRMNHHQDKCRTNYNVNEKTVCPFNDEHLIFEQETESQTTLCPDRPDDVDSEAKKSDDKPREGNEMVDGVKVDEKDYGSDLHMDKALAKTGCINGLKVGGLKDFNVDSTNEDIEEVAVPRNDDESTMNGETETTQENGANDKESDLEDMSVNAVSHMAGFEPQDDNIAIEKQLSQSKANLSTSVENGTVSETNGNVEEEQFDYKKYAPTKEEREEFLKLIKEHKEEQNGVDESSYQNYLWQGYGYITQPFQPNHSYPGMYNPGTTFIAYPNGTYHAVTNGQPPYHYPFQPGSGPVPHYYPSQVQGYEYNNGYTPRQHYRRPYRGRNNYHHNNHSYNRHHNGYHKHNHYNGHRNHYNQYNGYYHSHDTYSHTDTDSNSSASGQSDTGSADHSSYNGNGHHSDNERPHHPRRTNHTSKGSVNLERIIHVNTDSDGESGPPSINGHMLDLSPEPSENYESMNKRKGEKDKVVRKLRKKLNEIYALENKKNSGVQIDCDQLKKLSRKKELEDELAALTID